MSGGAGDMTDGQRSAIDEYLDIIDDERDARPSEAMLADEIKHLREVLVFADGFVVSQTSQWSDHTMVLADLYNETTPLQGVIQRAGCHPRRRFRDG